MAPPVHAGYHDNEFVIDAKKDSIGKATQERPPGLPVYHRIPCGVSCEVIECRLKGPEKLFAKALSPALVPKKCFFDISGGRRTDEDGHQGVRLRIRRSTSSQGMPSGPSRSSSSRRLSSSSRCAFVSGTASGLAERLSHSSSRSRRRSSALSFAMSIVGMASLYADSQVA